MQAKVLTTEYTDGIENQLTEIIVFRDDSENIELNVVNIYPEIGYELFEGFGGAITDAAGYVYSLMSAEQKMEVIRTYFTPENMNYKLIRVHMDSCDFSLEQYQAMEDGSDREMKSFSFARTEKYIIPMLEDAREAAGGDITLMLSPWSPPTFMKTNGMRVSGGEIKKEFRDMWAQYICRYIREFTDRGFRVERISLQNEPMAVQTWDSCIYTAEQEKEFLRDYMIPALHKHGLSNIEVFIWDHNKERAYERLRDIADSETEDMISGVAFHWYSGDHFETLELIRQKHPDKKLIMSESCLEFSKFDQKRIEENADRLSHEIIGDMNHGMCAFYDWNILLDSNGGPNHVGNFVHAPFLYNIDRQILMRQRTLTHFYHFCHYIVPGSRRVAFSRYTDRLEVTAYKRPDHKIVIVILSRDSDILPVNFRINGKTTQYSIRPKAIVTVMIDPD